jgi:predicted transcriptional regulator
MKGIIEMRNYPLYALLIAGFGTMISTLMYYSSRADKKSDDTKAEMNRRFGEMDRRFGEMDRRFGEVSQSFREIREDIKELRGDIKNLYEKYLNKTA